MTEFGYDRRRIERFNRIKRMLDLSVVILTAPLTVPAGVLTSILVRWRLGRPVLFRQVRPGLNEKSFELLKFRTMTDARDADGQLLPDRERLTKFGARLRSLSLDELPQLINVARGEMSFIGPRPLLPSYLDFYSEPERIRHAVRPGISGLAQVSGRNHLRWPERLGADSHYVRTSSLAMDARILWRTIAQVLRREDVSVIAADSGQRLDIERAFARSDTLILRRLSSDDLSLRVLWVNDATVREYMQWPDDVTDESTHDWFERVRHDPQRIDLVAVDARTRESVAMAGLVGNGAGTFEFYVFVDPQRHGQGIGKQVTELAVEGARQVAGACSMTLTVARANIAALKIYEDLGFEMTKRGHERFWMRRSLVD